MKRTISLSAVLAVLMLGGRPAWATTVITFDDLSDGGGGTPISSPYQGLDWTNFGVLNTPDFTVNDGPNGYANGTVSGPNVAYNESGTAAMTTGTPFTFNSAYFTAAWNDGLTIDITGKLGGVTEDTTSFVVNTSGPTLETFNWTDIDELDFSSFGGVNHGYNGLGTQFAMDNMTINGPTTATPEPHLLLFLIAGLSGIVAVQRWKTAKN
jgi:hypothetical protein